MCGTPGCMGVWNTRVYWGEEQQAVWVCGTPGCIGGVEHQGTLGVKHLDVLVWNTRVY